jgi:hypothetical protein
MEHYHFSKLKQGQQLLRGVRGVKLLLDFMFLALGVRH